MRIDFKVNFVVFFCLVSFRFLSIFQTALGAQSRALSIYLSVSVYLSLARNGTDDKAFEHKSKRQKKRVCVRCPLG